MALYLPYNLAPFSTSSAIFSASIYTVAIGWPGGKKGKLLASTTRKPLTPRTLARGSSTAMGSFERTDLARDRGMPQSNQALTYALQDFLVGADVSISRKVFLDNG